MEDVQGRIHEISQPFSLDNSIPPLKFFSQWPLNVYFPDLVSIYYTIILHHIILYFIIMLSNL